MKKYPSNRMLGEREMLNGKVRWSSTHSSIFLFLIFVSLINILYIMLCFQAGKYVWLTYEQVYDLVLKVGNSIRVCGVAQVSLKNSLQLNFYKAHMLI